MTIFTVRHLDFIISLIYQSEARGPETSALEYFVMDRLTA